MSYDNWWDYRGEAIDVTDVSKYDDSADLLKAVEFFKDPENHFNTVLPEEEEKEFQKWFEKAKEDGYISEADTGIDYDYRGYWREFPKRGREIIQNGHFPDRYKSQIILRFQKSLSMPETRGEYMLGHGKEKPLSSLESATLELSSWSI